MKWCVFLLLGTLIELKYDSCKFRHVYVCEAFFLFSHSFGRYKINSLIRTKMWFFGSGNKIHLTNLMGWTKTSSSQMLYSDLLWVFSRTLAQFIAVKKKKKKIPDKYLTSHVKRNYFGVNLYIFLLGFGVAVVAVAVVVSDVLLLMRWFQQPTILKYYEK